MAITRAAVIQAAPLAFDTDATLDWLGVLVERAAAAGAQLAVLPEAFVGGYPKGYDFGARVGSRTPEGREWFRRYHAAAVEVPGPATARLGELARAHAMHLVVGAIERAGGTLYCTAVFLGPDGALIVSVNRAEHPSLIEIRAGFEAEIVKTMENF